MEKKKIKVLSLFDGMACGMIAMKNAGIEVERYVAYEIDKYAIKTATHNFPEIEEKGDVFDADFTQYQGFDWLIGGSPCEPAGTKIKVENGYKNIEDICIGDKVLTHKNRYMPVIKTMSRKAEHLYHVKFNGSEDLRLTGNHPIYIYRDNQFKWIPTEQVKIGDYVCCNINQGKAKTNYSDNMLWLLGRFVADGYIDDRPRACFAIGQKKRKEFETHLTGIHFYINHKERPAAEYMIEDKCIVAMCQKIKNGSINKCAPDEILNLPADKLKIFFDGYFSGDGHQRKNRESTYMWSTISTDLCLSMAMVSAKCFGKYPTITRKIEPLEKVGFDGRKYRSHDSFNSQISLGHRKGSQKIIDDKILIPIKNIYKEEIGCTVYNMQVAEDESYTSNNVIVHNCTYWSIAQKNNRETEASGMGWDLFCQYVRALHEAKPKYFIYENNKSMAKAIRDSIRKIFGFEEICINSALVSAQNRQRYYWVGKRNEDGTYSKVNVEQPEDRGILLKDVLDSAMEVGEKDGKSWVIKSQYYKMSTANFFNDNFKGCNYAAAGAAEPVCVASRGRYSDTGNRSKKSNGVVEQYYEVRDGEKTNALTTVSKDNMVAEPIRVGCMPSPNGEIKGSQANRVYSSDGKAVNQVANGGGWGAKTGLYAVPISWELANLSEDYYHGDKSTNIFGKIECKNTSNNNGQPAQGTRVYNTNCKAICLDGDSRHYIICAIATEFDDNGVPVKAISGADGKQYTVYHVENGQITIKEKQYPIKLVDGYYIIRKLTVNECKRLQTVPDWYDFSCVSNTQAYKMLGNGWTCDVITHLICSCFN